MGAGTTGGAVVKRLQRKTTPRVVAGRVWQKNRTEESPSFSNILPGQPVVHRLKPGFGYRHVLRQKDVTDFLGLLPDWEELSKGLRAILLAPGEDGCDGWYGPGVVALCAWDRGLWQVVDPPFYADHQDLFARLEVPCEKLANGSYLCRFTEPAVRAYQLLHVLLHELGHHQDRMTTRSRVRSCRGEGYAESYAREYEQRVWDRYLAVFGLY
jgi:hypothetical protein